MEVQVFISINYSWQSRWCLLFNYSLPKEWAVSEYNQSLHTSNFPWHMAGKHRLAKSFEVRRTQTKLSVYVSVITPASHIWTPTQTRTMHIAQPFSAQAKLDSKQR